LHSNSTQTSSDQNNTVSGWLEIDPQTADVATIEKHIQAKLSQHDPNKLPLKSPVKLVYQLRTKMLGDHSEASMLDKLGNLNINPALLQHIQQANESNTGFDMSMILTDSTAMRVPILGRIWHLIRTNAHNLVLFYTNSATKQQLGVNKEMLNTINRLTILIHEQQECIDALDKQLTKPTSSTSASASTSTSTLDSTE